MLIAMTALLVIFQIIITTMAAIKIKAIAIAIIIKQVSKAITTVIIVAIAMRVEEVGVLIALVALQAAHVLQEFHRPMLLSSIFLEVSFRGKFYR
jgi:hypothetical protein